MAKNTRLESKCEYDIELKNKINLETLSMQIVNHINESVGTSVELRQKTNDANFDYVIKKITDLLP